MTRNEDPLRQEAPIQPSPVDTFPEGEAAPETPRRRIPAFAVVLFIGVLFMGGLLALMLIKPPQKALCDEPAPDWTLTLFPEWSGGWPNETISLTELRGKGVVMNFWASWCGPCEEEAALLEATWRKYQDQGIVFVGVDYLDQDPAAKRYLEKFDITYPNGPDLASKISKRHTIRGVPETFFIDPEGNLVGCRKIGPFLSAEELENRIAEIMPDD